MDSIRLQTAQVYQGTAPVYKDVAISAVRSVNFTPIGSIAEQSPSIRAEGKDVSDVLQMIDFANPFVTEDKPGAILVGQLTITYENEGKEEQRTFRVLGYSLIQDVCFPTTYYYAADELEGALKQAK